VSDILLTFRGREIRAAELAFLRQLIADHPDLSRRALSVRVCQGWKWTQPNGQWRDQVCRSLMLRLHRSGHIELPAPRQKVVNNAIHHREVRTVVAVDTTPIEGNHRAANWQCVGRSSGQGTKSRRGDQTSVKELWVYPLGRNFRAQLLTP